MAETKTKPTGASVEAYLASRASPEQLAGCEGTWHSEKEASLKCVTPVAEAP
jgi:hypothetical protein